MFLNCNRPWQNPCPNGFVKGLGLGITGPLSIGFWLGFGLLVLSACGEGDPPKPADGAKDPSVVLGTPVEVMVISPKTFILQRTYVGELQPFQRVRLYSETEGFAEKVVFALGDRVKKGSLLAHVSSKKMRAQRDLAKVSAKLADSDYKRSQDLGKQGVISATQIEQVTTKRDTARLNLRISEINYQASIIRSPIAGKISKRLIEQGEFVRTGSQVAEVLDLSKMKAVFSVPESDVRFFKVGNSVTLTFDALPQTTLTARVKYVGLEAGKQDKNYQIEAEVNNAKGTLRAGMLTRATSDLEKFVQQILVPRYAVLEQKGQRVVFVEQNGKAVEKSVITGVNWQGDVHVLKGLSSGERLVITGHQRIRGGDAVLAQVKQGL